MPENEIILTFSNSTSLDMYPENKLNRFKLLLSPGLNFKDESWEVALVKISVPNSWYSFNENVEFTFTTHGAKINKPKGLDYVLSTIPKENRDEFLLSDYGWEYVNLLSRFYEMKIKTDVLREVTVKIPRLHFSSWEEARMILKREMMKAIVLIRRDEDEDYTPERWKGTRELWSIDYDNSRNVIVISDPRKRFYSKAKSDQVKIKFNKGLDFWNKLGFTNLELDKDYKLPLIAETSPRIALSVPLLHIYAPQLIDPQFVGGTLAPLLELLPFDDKSHEETISLVQRNPTFKKVVGGYISNIEIQICDNSGNFLAFSTGEVQITLLFRKCRSMITSGRRS